MRIAVIDIGSNSTRLMLADGDTAVEKISVITGLAKNLGEDKLLKDEAVERCFNAVSFFIKRAEEYKAKKILAFATAGVRQANNKEEFMSKFKSKFNINLDLVSGEEEALLGLYGAVNGLNGGVIDIGGASTEVIAKINGNVVYKNSLNFGCVNTTNTFNQDKDKLAKYLDVKVKDFNQTVNTKYFAIGGTATSLSAILQNLPSYDANLVHGYKITLENLVKLKDKLYSMNIEERQKIPCLQKGREEYIANGASILIAVMNHLKITEVTVSESDNLEGYLKRNELND